MSVPILLTKLFIPPARPELVTRSRLIEQLNHNLHRKLTLISAPAGFGKTTLVTDWLQSQGDDASSPFCVCWLSLDESDNDAVRFLVYLISALNRIQGLETEIGASALQLLQSPQPPPPQTILIAMINEIALVTNKIVLIMDDYHLIDSQKVHESLNFLLENLPPQMHLVIATREDPPIQISRLRARGQLNELRALDLRFTGKETAVLLNQVMGLNLSAEDIAALETRTEGWIAGLQLASISMQGHDDVTSFIQAFSGSDRLVLDYLIEEVINQQPDDVQNFLLQTAILNRFSGSLCNAVTMQINGQAMLEMLEHTNLFVIPLDNERNWYRYHHLFADLLHQRLRHVNPEQVSTLHQRASKWYENDGDADKAFHHALAAGDPERAANIIEPICMIMITDSRLSRLRSWLLKLPDVLIAARPWLCVSGAWANLLTGNLSDVEKLLHFADSSLSDATPETLPDHDQIYGYVTTIRAFIARWQEGDIERSLALSQDASKYVPANSVIARSALTLNLGIANLIIGELSAAASALDEALTVAQKGKNFYAALAAFYYLGQVQVKQGYLHQAAKTYRHALQLGIEWGGGQPLPATGYAHIGLSQVLYEWNALDEALIHLTQGIELAELVNETSVILDGTFILSQLKLAQGEIHAASDALEHIQAILNNSTRAQVTSQLSAQKAQLWLVQDDLASALHWAREREALIDDEIHYTSMPEYLAFAQVLIVHGETDKAFRLLIKLRDDADLNGRKGDLIKILTLQALSLQIHGDSDQAITTLENALIRAETEGFVRTFVDAGPPMARLLHEALSRGSAPDYVQRLLAAFPVEKLEQLQRTQTQSHESEWIEPLSDREIEVLRLIAEGISRQEIASQLVLSLNTVKTHARNIYSKLGVHSQMQAVGKARALGLLENE